MALAVLIDFFVITRQGIDFWSHYCVSPAYWFLLAAYFVLWLGGSVFRSLYAKPALRELGVLAVLLVASVGVSYLISNGSYYWISDSWRTAGQLPSFGGWVENLGDWFLPYLRTTAIYVGVAAALHVGATLAAREIGETVESSRAASHR
jgi:branched-subunit amino acid ABC-type transport system permease component